jgi:hypothetical protein
MNLTNQSMKTNTKILSLSLVVFVSLFSVNVAFAATDESCPEGSSCVTGNVEPVSVPQPPSSGGGGGGGGGVTKVVPPTSPTTPTTPTVTEPVVDTTGTVTTTTAPVGQVLGATSFRFTKKLQLGSKGNEVVELQKKLIALGFLKGKADGKFGKATKLAVIKFQKAHNLKGDGVVGTGTRAELNK